MKSWFGFLLILLAVLTGASRTQADAIDDQYVRVYNLIQEGDALSSGGQSAEGIAKYTQAQKDLLRFQRMYPTWNTTVVAFRLNYLSSRVPESPAGPSVIPNPASSETPQT